jgi:phospholipase C
MQSNIQKKIDHVVVLMMENRSFDNLLGWLYEKDQPLHFLPTDTPDEKFNGLTGKGYSNPLKLNDPSIVIKATKGKGNFRVPNPDPHESFMHMNQQLFGLDVDYSNPYWLPKDACGKPNMRGFLADYVSAKCSSEKIAPQIMQSYTPENLTVLSDIATKYAVSDNYHASSPTQTWPNRAFMHTGTSAGNVNNEPYFPYDNETIFNVLYDKNVTWTVYKSSKILPSLTRIQMRKLWHSKMDDCFKHVDSFIDACNNPDKCTLPAYSFIEPSFVVEDGANATSEHPPANVCAGDHFLQKIVNAVVGSKHFDKIFFIINFDEHGGCPDHVPPSCNAVPPDEKSLNNKSGFKFNRYGVRVPALFVSPYIKPGTCIRANSNPWEWSCSGANRPFDHTSLLAMLLDWKNIDRKCLPSKRVLAAPKNLFDDLLAAEKPNNPYKKQHFSAQCHFKKESKCSIIFNFIKGHLGFCADGQSLTSLQKSILIADLHYRTAKASGFKEDVFAADKTIAELLKKIKTEKHMLAHFQSIIE